MKKFLVMLMVVAMASFLFVGCFGTTPPIEPDEPDEPVEPVLPPSVTPVIEEIINVEGTAGEGEGIISLYSSATQYMNADEVADGILVLGVALKYSEVNVYVGGIVVGTSTTYGVYEEFTVFVAEDNLGADGAKTLYATATELGFAESAHSTEYAFTLDTVAPELVSVTAEAEDVEAVTGTGTITATFDEELDEDSAEVDVVDNWEVKIVGNPTFEWADEDEVSVELISPEVVGIEGDFIFAGELEEGDLVRVDYIGEELTDLAGNLADESFGYCYLEIEEVEPEPDPTNEAPVITSTVITSGTVGELYIYTVVAEDPDEDDLTYSLTEGPLGMTIVATTGVINWTPTAAGFFGVGVKVADPDGLFDVQDFVITVTAPTVIDIAAILGVTAPVTGVIPVTEITETVQYTGTVTWSGTPVIFAAGTIYTATITLTPEAGYTLTGVAADLFTVAGAVATNPINSGVVTALFPVTAPAPTVSSAAFLDATNLQIVYSEAVTTVFGDYTPGAVTNGGLGTADTFIITNVAGSGTPTITLTVEGFLGAVSTALVTGDSAVIAIADTVASFAVPTNTLVAIPAQAVAAF